MAVTRHTLFATLFAMGLCGTAVAETSSVGLGQAWPTATDVSVSPHYHVYRFVADGIVYVQINDASGNPLGAIGTSGGQFIVLPIGKFAQLVSTPQQPAAAPGGATPTASATTVYADGSNIVTATPMSDGSTKLNATTEKTQAPCTDPAACGSHGP